MSGRTLEDRLVDAIARELNGFTCDHEPAIRLAISVALTEARREGYETARKQTYERWSGIGIVPSLYPPAPCAC